MEIGRLVQAKVNIQNVTVGEPDIGMGTWGRVVRVEHERGLILVRWQMGKEKPMDHYAKESEIEVSFVEGK